jgi:uracil-DNA glycosylase family 4
MANPHNKNYHAHYLKTMGIEMWVRRSLSIAPMNQENSESVESTSPSFQENTTSSLEKITPAVVEMPSSIFEKTTLESTSSKKFPHSTEWNTLQQEVSACTACKLCKTRIQTVFGVGNRQAHWLFVGEAPGADEDAQGEPFVGRAGKLLDSMFYALNLPRESVYIANILKCRPPENRAPSSEEMVCCTPFLHRQIDLIKPKIIIALGAIAAQHLLSTETPIGKLRGTEFTYSDTGIPLIATYHPAYLLRKSSMKRESWKDLLFAQRVMNP